MKTSRRTNATLLTLAFACGSAAQASYARATRAAAAPQSPTTNQPRATQGAKTTDKTARDAKARADAARARRERQAAVAILLEVERDAASLEEPYERADVFAACADALWDADEREARVVFRRAWESAVEADEADFKYEQENGRDGDAPELFTDARESVLTAAAKRDTRMSEVWLRALDEWLGRHDSVARETRVAAHEANPLDEFTRDARRLALASSLLAGGDYAGAARVAAPAAAGRVSGPLVEFLLALRARAPVEADRLYLSLLASARASSDANANDVLLLSSYALTPRLLAVVDDDGSISFRALGAQDPTADAATRAAFFDAASSILLRAPSGAAGDSALYFAVGRLLPFFEREAPRHAPALRARLSALASGLEATRRASLDAGMETRSLTAQNPTDPLGPMLEDIERADAEGRGDLARSKAVEVAARRKLWERAKRLADGIKNVEARDAARFLIAVRQVVSLSDAYAEGDAEDFEKAAAFARQADLSPALAHAFRAYGLAQAAELASRRGKGDRAASLLDEAIGYAQQTENGTKLRAAASLLVATFAARIAPARQWETLAAAVASINAAEAFNGNVVEFSGDGVKYYPQERETAAENFKPFTIARLFEGAGAADLARAAAEARNVEDVLARDYALVASARAALRKGSGRAGLLRRGGK